MIRYTPGMEEGPPSVSSGKKMPDQAAVGDDVLSVSLRAIGDVDTFLTPAGSGSRVTISYLDGWDGSLFGKDWTGVFPVVLPKELYDEYGGTIALSWKGFHICEVAGYYTGSVDGGGDSILLQGVVDCCFETDGGLTVVDFKTDRVKSDEELRQRTEH